MDLICIDSVGANRHTTSDAAKVLTAECPRRFFRALIAGCTKRRVRSALAFHESANDVHVIAGDAKETGRGWTIRF
jgi:hypothetical protein